MTTINEYMKSLKNPAHLDDLTELRAFLGEQLPKAEETMKYSMPTFEQNGHVVVSVASQKNYMSLYMDMDLVEAHRAELPGINCGKSCIRFSKLEKLPLDVIAKILEETVEQQSKLT